MERVATENGKWKMGNGEKRKINELFYLARTLLRTPLEFEIELFSTGASVVRRSRSSFGVLYFGWRSAAPLRSGLRVTFY